MSRPGLVAAVLLMTACAAPKRPPAEPARPDPTGEPWYAQTVAELQALTGRAELHFRRKQRDRASQLIEEARPLAQRVIEVPRPTLAAAEAASDLDDLYGRMLLAGRHFGWARLQFQKNVARWTHWRPQTAESQRRLKAAQDAIVECDRRIERQ